MLASVLRLRFALQTVVSVHPALLGQSKQGKAVLEIVQDDRFWLTIKETDGVLEPFGLVVKAEKALLADVVRLECPPPLSQQAIQRISGMHEFRRQRSSKSYWK